MKLRNLVLGTAICLGSGCATIVGDSVQSLPISSTPSDAAIVITDETGREVFRGATPTAVALQKSDGSYWGGKSYTVVVTKPGFLTQTIPVESGANGWYIAGNALFGGLIGWFVVDPLNGKMYTLSPESITASLGAGTAHNNAATDGSISVVLLQDVPESLRDQLTSVN